MADKKSAPKAPKEGLIAKLLRRIGLGAIVDLFPGKTISLSSSRVGLASARKKKESYLLEDLAKKHQKMLDELAEEYKENPNDTPETKKKKAEVAGQLRASIDNYYAAELAKVNSMDGSEIKKRADEGILRELAIKNTEKAIATLRRRYQLSVRPASAARILGKIASLERELDRYKAAGDKSYEEYYQKTADRCYADLDQSNDNYSIYKELYDMRFHRGRYGPNGNFAPGYTEPSEEIDADLTQEAVRETPLAQQILSPDPATIEFSKTVDIYSFQLKDDYVRVAAHLSPAQERVVNALLKNGGVITGPKSLFNPRTLDSLISKGILEAPAFIGKEEGWTVAKVEAVKDQYGLKNDATILRDRKGVSVNILSRGGVAVSAQVTEPTTSIKPEQKVVGIKANTFSKEVNLQLHSFTVADDVDLSKLTPKQRAIIANIRANTNAPLEQYDMRSLKGLINKGIVSHKPLIVNGEPVYQKYTGESYKEVLEHRQEHGTYIKTESNEYVILHKEGTITRTVGKDGHIEKEGIKEFIDKIPELKVVEEEKKVEEPNLELVDLPMYNAETSLLRKATHHMVEENELKRAAAGNIMFYDLYDKAAAGTLTVEEFKQAYGLYPGMKKYIDALETLEKEGAPETEILGYINSTVAATAEEQDELLKLDGNMPIAEKMPEVKNELHELGITPAEYRKRVVEDTKYEMEMFNLEHQEVLLSPDAKDAFDGYDSEKDKDGEEAMMRYSVLVGKNTMEDTEKVFATEFNKYNDLTEEKKRAIIKSGFEHEMGQRNKILEELKAKGISEEKYRDFLYDQRVNLEKQHDKVLDERSIGTSGPTGPGGK